MKIYTEDSITNFDFWGGAKYNVQHLTYNDMRTIEDHLNDIYSEIEDVQLNDIFWFEDDFLAQCLGYDDWESLLEDKEDC